MKSKLWYSIASLIIFAVPLFANAQYDQDMVLTVAKDDNLVNICKKYLEDPQKYHEIARINRLTNPDRIYPGEKLIIPVRLLKGIPFDGEVTFIKGDVRIQLKKGEKWYALHLADLVKQGSRIKTGDESATEVTYKDGASVFLRSNTTLGVLTASKKIGFPLVRELFLGVGRAITKIKGITGTESRFEIQTPSAVAAPRGTEFRVSVDSVAATRSEVLKGVVGVEAVNQQVMVNEGEGTLVRKGTPPVTPKKLLPPPALVDLKSLYRKMPLRFKFENVEGASNYRVMLARDGDFKDVLKEKVIVPQGVVNIVGVADGTYYLQIRSIDRLGLEGIPSEPEIVRVRVNPMPPFIQSPVDGAEYRQKAAQFKWLKVKDALGYHVQVAEDGKFNVIVEDRDDVKDVEYKTGTLKFKTYYFRVSSFADDGYKGVWSDALRFTMIPPPPSPPVEKPEISKEEIKIRWRDLGEGIMYHFQMAKDKSFKEILIDKKFEAPEATFTKPEEFGSYYVRTSGIDSEGYEGNFSLPQSFEIKPPSPYVQELEIGESEIHIKWNDLGENIMYHFQMASDKEFKEILLDKKLEVPEATLKKPDVRGLYYIRISSIASGAHEGDFSLPRGFEIEQGFPYEAEGIVLTP